MHAHGADFRSEVEAEGGGDGAALEEALIHDWRRADLPAADRALCGYAEALARDVDRMEETDLAPLRAAGFDDRAIHDAAQVVAYFSYINRIAEGLGVDLEPEMPPRPGTPDGEGIVRAAGEAMGTERAWETGSFSIPWECPRCRRYFPAARVLPKECDHCGTPRTEFVPSEER